MKWLDFAVAAGLESEGTDAYRIASGREGRIERYGSGIIISHQWNDVPEAWTDELMQWITRSGAGIAMVYQRKLVHAPGRDDVPRLITGDPHVWRCPARENGLTFAVDLLAGYSCGLFLDQRANREKLVALKPKRVLNTFSYTCAFSVAAAANGAETLSVDLAKASLGWGRENFELNNLSLDGHRFIADDVFDVLPRLARRSDKFDAIILDPPTFSRGQKGKVFRVEKDYARLVELAAACAAPGAWLLLSTNYTGFDATSLREIAQAVLPGRPKFSASPSQPDIPAGQGASTVWVQLD